MPTLNLGRREVEGLRKEKPCGVTYYDEKLKGFGLRFHTTGKASFILEYRPIGGGRRTGKKRITIGTPDAMQLEFARNAAKDMLANIRLGADPIAERQAVRRAETVNELIEEYMEGHVRAKLKPRTVESYEGYAKNYIGPEWGTRKAGSIVRLDMTRLHKKIGKGLGKPGAANRLTAFVSGAFRWASLNGLLPETYPNPARSIKKFDGVKRERFLGAEEFGRLGDALRLAETAGIPWAPDPTKKIKHAKKEENRRVVLDPYAVAAIRLLMLTGCRLREILHLKWSNVNFERGVLILADSKTGAKTVVLPASALAILKKLDRVGVYVIAGESAGAKDERPRADLQRPWARIIDHAGLTGLRIHDLRHSFASVAVAGGLNLPVVGKLLGHANVSTTHRYAHLADDPVRAAANVIAGTIMAQLEGSA